MTGSRVIALPSIDAEKRVDAIAPAGASIGEIVEFALPGATPDIFDWVRVSIGNDIIPREMWEAVRPKPETVVVVRVLPGNGGALRAALSISVAVAALALGQVYGAPMALAAGFGEAAAAGWAGSMVGGVISATTLLAGTLLINALVPIRHEQASSAGAGSSPTYSVQGFRNVPNPDGVVPCVMGKVRFAPPYAALPYTDIINGETFVRALFLVGYGPVSVTNIRIGDTPIERYKEITYEIREGYATDAPITLYPMQVLEERLTTQLSVNDVGGQTRFTASDANEVQIDVQFPSGLFWMHTFKTGSTSNTYPLAFAVVIRVSYRLEGVGAWTVYSDWNISALSQKAFSSAIRFAFPARGRYEIKLERLTPDYDDLNGFDQDNQYVTISIWSAIKSFRPEYPLAFNKPLALIAVTVRSSKQLNGILDNLSCEASRICADWDAATGAWIDRETQNPASLFRYAMQGPAAAYPVTDAQLDLAQLQDWHAFCASNNLAYNRVQDYDASIFDVMSDIAGAGRASPRDDGTMWGVVVDQKQTVTIAHMTPRNAWGFSGERPYVVFPHAFRVKFYDDTNSFKPAERVIPWPGFVGTPSIVESIDIPGVTSPDQIWMEARKRQYELIYRRDSFSISQDFEGAIARRGDLVRLSYDTLVSTQKAARVSSVRNIFPHDGATIAWGSDTLQWSNRNDLFWALCLSEGIVITIDDTVKMEAGKSYAVRIRALASTSTESDLSIVRAAVTVPGETNSIILSDVGLSPEVGDLIMFGEASQESMECIVREVEGADDFARHFTLIPHASNIFDLLAIETPPAWNGRAGSPVVSPSSFNLKFLNAANSQYLTMGWP